MIVNQRIDCDDPGKRQQESMGVACRKECCHRGNAVSAPRWERDDQLDRKAARTLDQKKKALATASESSKRARTATAPAAIERQSLQRRHSAPSVLLLVLATALALRCGQLWASAWVMDPASVKSRALRFLPLNGLCLGGTTSPGHVDRICRPPREQRLTCGANAYRS